MWLLWPFENNSNNQFARRRLCGLSEGTTLEVLDKAVVALLRSPWAPAPRPRDGNSAINRSRSGFLAKWARMSALIERNGSGTLMRTAGSPLGRRLNSARCWSHLGERPAKRCGAVCSRGGISRRPGKALEHALVSDDNVILDLGGDVM